MINKIVQSMADAMAGIKDGSTVLIGGFGAVGQPDQLIEGLIAQGATDLTCVANNAGTPAPAARIRSAMVPWGTISSSILPWR